MGSRSWPTTRGGTGRRSTRSRRNRPSRSSVVSDGSWSLPRVWLRGSDHDPSLTTELLDGLFRLLLVERLPVPPLVVGQERDPMPLYRLRHDQRRAAPVARLGVRAVDGLHV